MKEIWKPIEKFPGYEISDHGNVRSFRNTHGQIVDEPHPLKPMFTRKGRPVVHLRAKPNGRKMVMTIHRLVLEAFVGPCPEGMQTCHYDDNPLNNHIDNLRWDTHAANVADAIRNGAVQRGERSRSAKLTNGKVVEIRERYAAGEKSGPLAIEFGVSRTSIRQVTSGRSWKHIGGPITFDHRVTGNHGIETKIPDEHVPEILERRENGESYKSIAKDFDVSNVTIRNYIVRHS